MSTQAKVKMFKKDPCPYCDRAKTLLDNRGIIYEMVDLTGKPEEFMAIKKETGWMTVPMIFINDQLIGGYDDLKALAQDGKLEELLKKN
jgi:glutaredoxin 3